MTDQADQLRQLVRQAVKARPTLGPGAAIVVLTGGLRGVGTTSLTVQLARELARLGQRTLLVDANLENPQLGDRLAVEPRETLADVLNGNRSLAEVLEVVDESISLVASPRQSDSTPDLTNSAIARLLTELSQLGAQTDVVLVDAGHGMTPWVQRWWRAAQQVFLITTEQQTVIKESYLTAKLAPWGDADGKLRLVVNQCNDRHTAQRISERFSATCRRFLGLHVAAAPPIARDENESLAANSDGAFCQSTRLLATEIVSHTLVVGARLANRQNNQRNRLADMIAPDENLSESSNKPQTAPTK